MKLLELDWHDFASWTRTWEQLPPSTRHALVQHRGKGAIDGRRMGQDLPLLTREGFVTPGRGGADVVLGPEAARFLGAIRAIRRHRLLTSPSTESLAGYIDENLSRREQGDLSRYGRHAPSSLLASDAASAGWVRSFLSAERAARTAPWQSIRFGGGKRLGESDTEASAHTIRRVVRALVGADAPVPIQQVPGLVTEDDPARVWLAVRESLRLLLVLPDVDDTSTLSPMIGIWPPALVRLNRKIGPPPTPLRKAPEPAFAAPYMIEDMTTVLAAAGAEPLPIKASDGDIYVRTLNHIGPDLMPLPDWLDGFLEEGPAERVTGAAWHLHRMRYLRQVKRRGGKAGEQLEPTPAGRRWLALPLAERLRVILDELRGPGRVRDAERTSAAHVRLPFVPTTGGYYVDSAGEDRLASGLEAAFGDLTVDRYVPFAAFETHARAVHNPLLEDDAETTASFYYGLYHVSEERREARWSAVLETFLTERLVRFGGARLGMLPDGGLAFALTSAGRYLCGRSDTFELDAMDDDGAVIVQPNFEVVFLAPAPRLEAEMARFTERLGSGVGTLFRLTPASIMTAAAAGISPERILETLGTRSSRPVPENVAREVADWARRAKRVSVRPARLVQCPDAETAGRVLAVLGRDAAQLSATVLELGTQPTLAAIRKLNRSGVFLDEGESGEGRS